MAIWNCFIRLFDWMFAMAESGHRRSTIRSIFSVAKFNDGHTDKTDAKTVQTVDDESMQVFSQIFGADAGATSKESSRFVEISGRQSMVGEEC